MSVARAHLVFPAQPTIQFQMVLVHYHVRAALISAMESAIVAPITVLTVLAPHLVVHASTLPLFL